MERYKKYLKELGNIDILETGHGFIIYQILGEETYIRDIFIEPEFRQLRGSFSLGDEVIRIAKEAGCKYITGTVNVTTKNCEISVKMQMSFGMKIIGASNNIIMFKREI